MTNGTDEYDGFVLSVTDTRLELGWRGESHAHYARRVYIESGRETSLVAYDPERELYVFDVYSWSSA